jgi:gas vesicle protein
MGQDPSAIREELEETRRRVGEEVEAISYKTDVGARMDDYVEDKKQAVKDTVGGARDAVTGTVGKVLPDRQKVSRGASRLRETAEHNPLGLAIGGAAAGFLAGLLLPSTRLEDERLGEASDRVTDTARELAQDAMERGKDVAQTALETAKEEGSTHGRELASDLKERVGQSDEAATEPRGRAPSS